MAGIPWAISRDSATTLIEPRGYNYNSTDADGDMWFDGVLMNTPTRVFAYMAQDSLVRLRVRMITTDENALATYARVRAELVRQYGRPYESSEEYHAPYTKGSNPVEAVQAGKAVINSHWKVGSGRRQTHITVQVPRELVVVIDYDGPNWNREFVRRQRSGS